MVPAALAVMAKTPRGARPIMNLVILVSASERVRRGCSRVDLSLILMRASPKAMLKITVAGMMLSVMERKGLEGMNMLTKLTRSGVSTMLWLKNEAVFMAGKARGMARMTTLPITHRSRSQIPPLAPSSLALSMVREPMPTIRDTTR
jgi:hypothetical protein